MTENPTPTLVVAAALIGRDGRVCMQQRPHGKNHGGLWEFPGGKVESGEDAQSALARELAEELGIAVDPSALSLAAIAPGLGIVIRLYVCREWRGTPACLEGEAIGWYVPSSIAELAMPPLDYPLARALEELLARGAI